MLEHSVGLQKGMIGVANLFAAPHMTEDNNIVITHEVLHTLGATDKYDLTTNLPQYPGGYAEPEATPLLPQRFAEIMGARIPITTSEAQAPTTLDAVVVVKKNYIFFSLGVLLQLVFYSDAITCTENIPYEY